MLRSLIVHAGCASTFRLPMLGVSSFGEGFDFLIFEYRR
jgi:hypothetical protein